jgi:hypothetical protein
LWRGARCGAAQGQSKEDALSSVLRRSLSAASLTSLVLMAGLSVTGVASARVAAPHMRTNPLIRATGVPHSMTVNSKPVTLSLNWSGYGATSSKKFNFVHSEYIQPAIKCNGTNFYHASMWTGLDGFNSNTVEQDGTDAACKGPGHMTPFYSAWYEMYPAASVNVFLVRPGDVIDSTVSFKHGMFTTTITDVTAGKSSSTSAACSECQRSSAEWVMERPAFCTGACTSGFIGRLGNIGTAKFNNAVAGVDGSRAAAISSFTNTPIDMINPKGNAFNIIAQTESLTDSGHSFTVVWQRHGTKVPISF